MNIPGSNQNPSRKADKPIEVKTPSVLVEEKKVLDAELERLTLFLTDPKKPDLPDAMIRKCDNILCSTVTTFDAAVPMERINEYRAETRGERAAWVFLKSLPDRVQRIKSRLNEIDKVAEKPLEDTRIAKWKTHTSQVKKS